MLGLLLPSCLLLRLVYFVWSYAVKETYLISQPVKNTSRWTEQRHQEQGYRRELAEFGTLLATKSEYMAATVKRVWPKREGSTEQQPMK
jgi:hypothetical protein